MEENKVDHIPVVLVPLAQGCEELEAITITDLLTRAGVKVITAGLNKDIVVASRGMKLVPDHLLDDVLDMNFDMIVLPGGQPGATHLERHVDHWLQDDPKPLAGRTALTEVTKASLALM